MLKEGSLAARLLLVRYQPLESAPLVIGVVLYVPVRDALYLRFRPDLEAYATDIDSEILSAAGSTIQSIAIDCGAKATFEWMETSLSNSLYVEDATELFVADPEQALSDLYREYCADDSE